MKALLIAVAMLVSAQSFAVDSLAKLQFGQMTAAQALKSPLFEKEIWNIQMPGAATWVNPYYGLCVNGSTVQTNHEISTCVQWTATNDGTTKSFNNKHDAENFSSNIQCSAQTSKILSTPINYTVKTCQMWAVDADDLSTKTFKYLASAQAFADSKDAVSNASPYCVKTAMTAKTMPTSYTVKFYTLGAKGDSSELLGSYTYAMRSCAN